MLLCRSGVDRITKNENYFDLPLMKIVILTMDNREPHKDYANPQPHFGTAPSASVGRVGDDS